MTQLQLQSDMQHSVFHCTDYVCEDYKSTEVPGKSPDCDLNLGRVCSLIIRALDNREHWDKVKKEKPARN